VRWNYRAIGAATEAHGRVRTDMKDSERGPGARLDALIDGVVAIVITLLVLDLQLPETIGALGSNGVWQMLHDMHGQIGSYLLSFAVIGIFWLNHIERVRDLARVDTVLVWLNLGFLAAVGLVPFTTALLSRNSSPAATAVYAIIMALAALMLGATATYAASRGFSRNQSRLTLNTAAAHFSIPFIFLASAGLAFLSPRLAHLSWLLIFPASLTIGWIAKHKAA
jgi:uncharacterized membrane protein